MAPKYRSLRRWLDEWAGRLRRNRRGTSATTSNEDHLSNPCDPNWARPAWGIEDSGTAACLRKHLDDARHEGLRFEVVAFDRARDSTLHVLFFDAASGEPAGGALVKIGETSADFERLDVYRAWQRRGIARFFDERLCVALIELGVEQVRMYAVRAGTYAWTRCGYEVAGGRDGLVEHVEWARPAIEQAVREGYVDASQAAALLVAVHDGTLTTRQVSEFGRDRAWTDPAGRTMWLGRLPFIGQNWYGIKRLRPVMSDTVPRD